MDKEKKYIDFYEYTKCTLYKVAKKRCLSKEEINKYFIPTDLKVFKNISELDGINQVFAQLCFHAQNRQRVDNIIDFEENFEYLKELTGNFDPKEFKNNSEEKILKRIKDDIKNKKTTIYWDSSKNKKGKEDVLIKQYIKSILNGAKFLSKFKSRKEVIDEIFDVYNSNLSANETEERNEAINKMIDYLSSKKTYDIFSYTMACDFIKELDKKFNFICKPDTHICETLKKLCSENVSPTKALVIMNEIVDTVNLNDKTEKLTCYKLDRMIWLLCSNNFFLHNVNNLKQKYIDGIK